MERSLIKTFLNTGTIAVPVWSLIGSGVASAKINYNPKTTEETYIHENSASISVDSYAPTIPIEQTAVAGSAVFNFIDALRIGRDTLDDVQTEIVNVWLYKTPYLGYYVAEKQTVSIQVDDVGGDGGVATKINYTINYIGNAVLGSFNPTPTAEFVPNPIYANLDSLDLDTVTLTPTFSESWLWYTGVTSSATDTITVSAEDPTATITIDVDGVGVDNGDPITWESGENIVTIEVTVGTEVVEYVIHVTYTPA